LSITASAHAIVSLQDHASRKFSISIYMQLLCMLFSEAPVSDYTYAFYANAAAATAIDTRTVTTVTTVTTLNNR
jgi:hypothetical protein